MKTLTLDFYSDPGHGWLKVDIQDLKELSIADKISSYSYKKANTAYLEEDCDAYLFMETAKQKGWQIEVKDHYQENTPIRNYPRY